MTPVVSWNPRKLAPGSSLFIGYPTSRIRLFPHSSFRPAFSCHISYFASTTNNSRLNYLLSPADSLTQASWSDQKIELRRKAEQKGLASISLYMVICLKSSRASQGCNPSLHEPSHVTSAKHDTLIVSPFIAHPPHTRSSSSRQFFFIRAVIIHDPRRSARIMSPQAGNNSQRSQTSVPALGRSSQSSSTTTTSYPSPTNDSRSDQNTSQLAHQIRYTPQLNSQPFMSQPHLNAPLPSPSAGDIDPFFGRPHPHPNPYQQLQQRQQEKKQQQQQQHALPNPSANQNQHHPHHGSFSQNTDSLNQEGILPGDFLAEAAKRAQMACLMRDLGDFSL